MQHKNTNYCNENEPKQKDIRTIAMNHKTQPNAAQKYKGIKRLGSAGWSKISE